MACRIWNAGYPVCQFPLCPECREFWLFVALKSRYELARGAFSCGKHILGKRCNSFLENMLVTSFTIL
jgi:hypothetical protein